MKKTCYPLKVIGLTVIRGKYFPLLAIKRRGMTWDFEGSGEEFLVVRSKRVHRLSSKDLNKSAAISTFKKLAEEKLQFPASF